MRRRSSSSSSDSKVVGLQLQVLLGSDCEQLQGRVGR